MNLEKSDPLVLDRLDPIKVERQSRWDAALLLKLQSELVSSYAAHLEDQISDNEINPISVPVYKNKAADARNIASIMFRAAELELTK